MRAPLSTVSTIPPDPIRILIAWSEPHATTVWRKLRRLGGSIDLTSVRVHQVGAYLRKPDYYHILLLHTSDWNDLDQQKKARYANTVCLIILGPEPCFASGDESSNSIVWVNGGKSTDDVLKEIVNFHVNLLAGYALDQCIELSSGCLSYKGLDAIWPQTHRNETQLANPMISADHDPRVSVKAGIGIGQVDVRGDMVYGDKVVFESTGDQVNQGDLSAAKFEQHTAGDQVNVTRSSTSALYVSQNADGEQINVNRLREPGTEPLQSSLDNNQRVSNSRKTLQCPYCFVDVHRNETNCPNCGVSLQRSRGDQ